MDTPQIGTVTIDGQTRALIGGTMNNSPHFLERSGRKIEVNWSMKLVIAGFERQLDPAMMEVLDMIVELGGVIYTGKAVVHEVNIQLQNNKEYHSTAIFYGIGLLKAEDDMR